MVEDEERKNENWIKQKAWMICAPWCTESAPRSIFIVVTRWQHSYRVLPAGNAKHAPITKQRWKQQTTAKPAKLAFNFGASRLQLAVASGEERDVSERTTFRGECFLLSIWDRGCLLSPLRAVLWARAVVDPRQLLSCCPANFATEIASMRTPRVLAVPIPRATASSVARDAPNSHNNNAHYNIKYYFSFIFILRVIFRFLWIDFYHNFNK